MQQNPILAALKLIVLTIFTVFLIMSFIQTEWLEDKVMRTREKVDTLGSNVSALSRKVDEASKAALESKEAADRTYERMNAFLDLAETGGLSGRTNGGAPASKTEPGTPTPEKPPRETTPVGPKGTKTTCNGVTVYARNPGWTVICDSGEANRDEGAVIPHDQVDYGAVLHGVLMGEPADLNNHGPNGDVEVEATWHLTVEILATRKHSNVMEYKAMLAERVEESPDRTQYMIYLRKRVPWHTPALDLAKYPWLKKQRYVTAKDVKFTYDIIRDPTAGCPNKVYYDEIEEVEIINDHQIKVTWSKPSFYNRASTVDIQPIPEHIWAYDPDGRPYGKANVGAAFTDHWFSKNICGNGPYRFVEYKPSQYIKYERFEDYWGERATCKEYYHHIIPDEEQRLAKFWNGELVTNSLRMHHYKRFILDGVENVTLRRYEKFNQPAPSSWKWTYFQYEAPLYSGFAWNMRREKLQDLRVRTALELALNRDAIVEKIRLGLGKKIAVGQATTSIYYPKDIEPLPFDPERAKKLLDEAGWIDTDGNGIRDKMIGGATTDLTINLVLSAGSQFQKQLAQMYKNDLIEIGVKLEADHVESALWNQRQNDRDFDGFIIFWYAGFDSKPEQLWGSKQADEANSHNLCGYKNPEADRIFDALHLAYEYPERIKLHHDWYQIQFRDQPYAWMNAFTSVVAVNADWRVPKPRTAPRPYLDSRLVFKWKSRP